MMMLMMLMEDICRTNGTVYCQISQLHPPESLTDGGRVTFKVRQSLRPSYHGSKNHSEPASSALARLRAEPRTPDGVLYETASEDEDAENEDRGGSEDEDKEDSHLASLRCQRCRCRRPLDSSWSNSRSPRLPRSPPAIKQRCWNCGGDGFGGGDDGDDHLSGQGEGGGGGGGGGRGCAGKTANLEDSKSY